MVLPASDVGGAPMPIAAVRLLGPLEVEGGESPLVVSGTKQRTIVSLLALRAGEAVGRSQLVDALWGDDPPPTAVKTLHSHVAHLRRALAQAGAGGVLVTREPGYLLAIPPQCVDARCFEERMAAGRTALGRGDAAGAVRDLRTALTLWRGDALADCEPGEWARAESTRLEETRLVATEALIEAELALGRHAQATADLEYLVARHPLRERLWGLLMLALHRDGRQAEALRAYERARGALVELGLEPGPDLRTLQTAMFRGETALLAQATAGAACATRAGGSAAKREGCLPRPLTSLVGRAGELAAVGKLIEATRLVTVTGAGGCGKTRLALEVARREEPLFPDGVAFIDLAAISDPGLVPAAVAGAVGAREGAGEALIDSVAVTLRDRHALLLLDNCEHLIDACARTVEFLLQACERLYVLATSREILGIAGEAAYPLLPLAVPDTAEARSLEAIAGYDAVRLFLDRAAAASGAFRVADGDAPAVARICASLDGLPLAIELAAVRTRIFTVHQIAQRLGDRFSLLAGGSRTAEPRHHALRAAVDWSYDLLSGDERACLRALSVFAGSFDFEAAQAVYGGRPVLDLVSSLVVKSLVQIDLRPSDARYRLLETIRQYASDKLAAEGFEAESVGERHACFFLGLAEETASQLRGPRAGAVLDTVEADHDNLRAALAWFARRRRADAQLRMAGALARYCYLRGHYREGREWLAAARSCADDPPPPVLARSLLGEGMLAFYECDYDEATALGQRALALYRELADPKGVAECLTLLGGLGRERGDYAAALARHREALALFREVRDHWGVGHSLQMAGFAAWLQGRFDEAATSSGDSLEIFRRLGDEERTAWALLDLGAVAHYRGDEVRSCRLLDESLGLFKRIGFQEGVAWAQNLLALVYQAGGQHALAGTLLERSLALHCELRDRWRAASVLEALAGSVCAAADLVRAAALVGAAAAIRDVLGTPVPPCERPALDRTRRAVLTGLGETALAEAYAAATGLALDQILAVARDGGPAPGAQGQELPAD